MGKLVVYDGEQSYGAPELAAGLGLLSILTSQGKGLLVHLGSKGEGIERGFRAARKTELHHELQFSEEGMDALFRMTESGRLHERNLADYTLPLLKGRLDLAVGHQYAKKMDFSKKSAIYRHIWRSAEAGYDRIVVQGSDYMVHQSAIHSEDKQVVVLRQDKAIIERYYERVYQQTDQQINHRVTVLYPYDEHSVLSIKNIKRMFKPGSPIVGIPYCSDYLNAWNSGEVLPFILRNHHLSRKNQRNFPFMNALSRLLACCFDNGEDLKRTEEAGTG